MKKMINTSMAYFIAAMVAGVFYREFTKFQGFTGKTTLGVMHTHLIVLGMFFFLTAALFCGMERSLAQNKTFRKFYALYNISLPFLSLMLLVREILQVNGTRLFSRDQRDDFRFCGNFTHSDDGFTDPIFCLLEKGICGEVDGRKNE